MSHPHSGDRPVGNLHGTRSPVFGTAGVIACSHPLASAAGLQIFQQGGNAIDAAVTAAAVLAVVEPSMTGIGGDVFALVYDAATRTLEALNSSGRAGARADAGRLTAAGLHEMPPHGPYAVTVPGAVAGWAELLRRRGTISLARAIAPAIRFARHGHAVSDIVAEHWDRSAARIAADAPAAQLLLPGGRPPRAGEIFRNPELANCLEQIASDGERAMYGGALGKAIAADITRRGGFLGEDDFAAHTSNWVDPIHTTYRGHDIYEMPPNSQGFVAIEMLNVLEGYDVAGMGHNSADYLHLLVEAKRIGFADRGAYLADPAHVPAGVLDTLLSKEYAAARRREIDLRRTAAAYAGGVSFAQRDLGDTVYLAAADDKGNVISFINSLFDLFGAGIVVPGTGIVLHSRGSGFSLQPGHPNQLAPGKRPLHTLAPAFVMKDGKPLMAFGVTGGDNQAQAHAQVVVNVVDFGMNVQEAGEAARVRHSDAGLAVESAVDESVRADLRRRGTTVLNGRGEMGGYQAVAIDPQTGVLIGGSDPRKDGCALGW
ncbi:MAG TPA: gamma-glutamyltransferase [Vicinamibacterales bacterium]